MKKIFAILSIAIAGAAFAQDDVLPQENAAGVPEISEPVAATPAPVAPAEPAAVVPATPAPVTAAPAPVAESSSSFVEEASYAASSSSVDIIGENDYNNMFGAEGSLNGTRDVEPPPARSSFDDDSIPELKRCKYTFSSWGIGMSIWHNWRDGNHDRDWDLALLLHHARIWEMTSHGSITFIVNANFGYDEAFETQGIGVLGGRYFFLNDIYSPYVGAGLGLGLQYDGHSSSSHNFVDKAAFGFAGNFEAGIVVFRTTTTQLDLGISYNVMLNVFAPSHIYGSFNVFLAINY
ncbi:MAG: hypothetical protein HUK19_00655 [Fibrobacter sp.]|nr:hypothetical protein [Fibrobacter sp.]